MEKGSDCTHAEFGTADKEAVLPSPSRVDIYNFEDSRCVESWSSGRASLAAAAVQHPVSGAAARGLGCDLTRCVSPAAETCSTRRPALRGALEGRRAGRLGPVAKTAARRGAEEVHSRKQGAPLPWQRWCGGTPGRAVTKILFLLHPTACEIIL